MKAFKKIALSFLALISLAPLAACNGEPSDGIYKKITQECKLTSKYEGKNFVTDGIGEAEVISISDGDTATFRLTDDNVVTIRFYGVDTPESTGAIEPWGKPASNFTKEIIKSAHSIVLEATATPAELDSYGSRYLGYVWYKATEESEYLNLNLQLVENGYSDNKSVSASKDKYYNHFKEAEKFAKSKKLHLHGTEADPYFTTDPIEINLKELNQNLSEYYNEEEGTGAKVRFKAFLKTLERNGKPGSQTYTFSAAQIVDGVMYQFPVYAQYESGNMAGYMKIGNEYSITGSIQKHGNDYQISGLTYVPLETGGDYLYCTKVNYYMQFNSSIEYAPFYGTSLYTDAKIEDAVLDGENIKLTATAQAHSRNGLKPAETFTILVPNAKNFDSEAVNALKGKKCSLEGIQEEKNGSIVVRKYKDIEFK